MIKKINNDLALWALLGLSVAAFVATPFIGFSKLSAKSQQLVSLKLQSKTANDQLASLAIAKKQIQKYSYFNDIAKTVIPNDKDQAQAVLDISQMAAASGIALQDITFPASSLGVKGTASTVSALAPTGTSSISQAVPVQGIAGLYSLQLTITPQTGQQLSASVATTYPKFLDFLNRIEHDRRTAQITQVTVLPQGNTQFINFTLIINIFIKP